MLYLLNLFKGYVIQDFKDFDWKILVLDFNEYYKIKFIIFLDIIII